MKFRTFPSVVRALAAAALLWPPVAAHALPPLETVQATAGVGLRVWWRQGALMVAASGEAGAPFSYPLQPTKKGELPATLSGWSPLGETCALRPEATIELDGELATARVVGTADRPVLALVRGRRRVAAGALGQAAEICALFLGEADSIPGPELLVLWRIGEGAAQLRGLTIMRVPDTAR